MVGKSGSSHSVGNRINLFFLVGSICSATCQYSVSGHSAPTQQRYAHVISGRGITQTRVHALL
jgi:hypothetical protein